MKKPLFLLLFIVFVCSSVTTDKTTVEVPTTGILKLNPENKAEKNSYGDFYESLEDLAQEKPLEKVKVLDGSFLHITFGIVRLKVKYANGEVKKVKPKHLPAELFTYRDYNLYADYIVGRDIDVPQELLRVIDKKVYIVLTIGALNYYALKRDEGSLYMAEGWNGELKKFKEKRLKKYLDQYGLWEQYLDDKPSREFKDNVNDYFNKTVSWRLKYIKILNEKMK